jgi:anti-repressor protein
MKTEKLRDSREVAAELEMRHDKLLRKLKGDKTHQGLIDRVQQQGEDPNQYFLCDTYQDSTGRTLPCYQISSKGYNLITQSLTGKKGTNIELDEIKKHEKEATNMEITDLATTNNQMTLTSMEVAEMVEKEHKKLLRDIRRYIGQMGESNIGPSEYFTESTYKDHSGKSNLCYQITKKGCEFIAHKLTGTKGTIFSVKYIERFHEMEAALSNPDSYMISDPIARAKRWIEEEETRQKLAAENRELIEENTTLKPKAEFHDAIMVSEKCITIEEMAKVLSSAGVSVGTNRLYRWLREDKILKCNNLPYQKYLNNGYFVVQETPFHNPRTGKKDINLKTLVTPKGQKAFVESFKDQIKALQKE